MFHIHAGIKLTAQSQAILYYTSTLDLEVELFNVIVTCSLIFAIDLHTNGTAFETQSLILPITKQKEVYLLHCEIKIISHDFRVVLMTDEQPLAFQIPFTDFVPPFFQFHISSPLHYRGNYGNGERLPRRKPRLSEHVQEERG